MIKLKVREKSLSFGSAKKRKTVHKEQNLEDKIALLEKELEQPSVSELQKNKYKRTTWDMQKETGRDNYTAHPTGYFEV